MHRVQLALSLSPHRGLALWPWTLPVCVGCLTVRDLVDSILPPPSP